ncbi:MAG: MAPEG family protein [Pseudomonadota bacterium]
MAPPFFTGIYAALLAGFFIYLSARTIQSRRSARVVIGTQGDETLLRRSRAHANFAEYVPLTLILMALAEGNGAAWWIINPIGLVLLAGRAIHAYGVSQTNETLSYRVRGMVMTFAALGTAAAVSIIVAVLGLFS